MWISEFNNTFADMSCVFMNIPSSTCLAVENYLCMSQNTSLEFPVFIMHLQVIVSVQGPKFQIKNNSKYKYSYYQL